MAQYKVPQNVEAEDKLLGPFSFRQFIYLLVAAGGIALAVALFQIFPLLAVIPVPVVLFFLVLALPLKKDQPMETYLAAVVSFHTKPHKRLWMSGQRATTVTIAQPKKKEERRTRDISEEEADHRLSFLADVIDSGGQSVTHPMRDDLYAEANNATDMFDTNNSYGISRQLNQATNNNHEKALQQMQAAIKAEQKGPLSSPHDIAPTPAKTTQETVKTSPAIKSTPAQPTQAPENPSLKNLATESKDLSISTIQKEADRRKAKKKEVFVALH